MPLYCFIIEQLVPYIHLLGTKQTVPAKQRKVDALFGTVLKEKPSAPNKAQTLRCFSWDNMHFSYQFIVLDKLFYPLSLQWHIKIKNIRKW